MNFLSDNTAPLSKPILQALHSINQDYAASYGLDEETQHLQLLFSHIFERPVKVFLVSTGTVANGFALGQFYNRLWSHSLS